MACGARVGSDVRGDSGRGSESATLVSMATTLSTFRALSWAGVSTGDEAGTSWDSAGLFCVCAAEVNVAVLTLRGAGAGGTAQGAGVVSMGIAGAGLVARGGREDELAGTQRRLAARAPSCAGGSSCGKSIASLDRTRLGRSCSRL